MEVRSGAALVAVVMVSNLSFTSCHGNMPVKEMVVVAAATAAAAAAAAPAVPAVAAADAAAADASAAAVVTVLVFMSNVCVMRLVILLMSQVLHFFSVRVCDNPLDFDKYRGDQIYKSWK